MERLTGLREPVTVVALVGLALHAVLTVVRETNGPPFSGFGLALLAATIVEPVLLLLLTALLVACWLGAPTRSARRLTLVALGLTALLSVAAVGLTAASAVALPWPEERALDLYAWLVPPATVTVICLAVQSTLLRRTPPPPAPAVAAGQRAEPEPEPEPEPEAEADPQLQPGWSPETAVGTVWRRAGDAASRSAATDWDAPGQSVGGWGSEPGGEPPVESPRRTDS